MTIPLDRFITTIEVVPPLGFEAETLLSSLESLNNLSFDGFSVATNPVAKPRMSAMAVCVLAQQRTRRPSILHVTTRDHNYLSLQAMLWGAKALGITTVLAATGDFVGLRERATTTTVRDLDVFGLVKMARDSDLQTGVVIDPKVIPDDIPRAVERLEKKIDSGAQFVVTQPFYSEKDVALIANAVHHIGIPVVMGILPLRTSRHAVFLHEKVSGISVPKALRKQMADAKDSIKAGIDNARDMLALSKTHFSGACIMPPFDHYEVIQEIL